MAAGGPKARKANPVPFRGTHRRYIPKRGDVLRRILRRLFGFAPPGRAAVGKVRPSPADGSKKAG